MPGGSRYELKWDGFRVGVVCREGDVRLWSRNGKDFTAKFPDVQAALETQLPTDCVLDGELVVWIGDRLDFDALQQRMVNTAATVRRRLAPAQPASFVAFDVLAIGGVDVRAMRWTVRRRRLESLGGRWVPPLQVSPVTADADEAREWLDAFKSSGVEGLVVKGASTRYQPGRRDWVKVNSVGVGMFGWVRHTESCKVRPRMVAARRCTTGVVHGWSGSGGPGLSPPNVSASPLDWSEWSGRENCLARVSRSQFVGPGL
jgi:ATP-dependent DNA ligase